MFSHPMHMVVFSLWVVKVCFLFIVTYLLELEPLGELIGEEVVVFEFLFLQDWHVARYVLELMPIPSYICI